MLGFEAKPTTREGAHHAAGLAYATARRLIEDGRKVRLTVHEDQEDWDLQQLRHYWGVILVEIAEQARVAGQRWTAKAWHAHLTEHFLGWDFTRAEDGSIKQRRISTTELCQSARAKYLLQVQAFAVTDLGVVFSEEAKAL